MFKKLFEYFKRKRFDFYLAGPMRGIPNLNTPLFNTTAAMLRRSGYTVFNPAEVNDDNLSFEECMRVDLDAVINKCESVVLLPGWRRSIGSNGEVFTACLCGRDVFEFCKDEDWFILTPVDTTKFKLPYRRAYLKSVQLSKGATKKSK